MTQRTYGFFVLFGGLINACLWLAILFFIDPSSAGGLGFFFFYSSFFFFVFGLLYGTNYFLYHKFFVTSSVYKNVQQSSRRAFLLSLLFTGLLFLQQFRLLTWYNLILFILGISIAEYILIARKTLRL